MSSGGPEGEAGSGNGPHDPLGGPLSSTAAPSVPQNELPPIPELGVWASPLAIDEDSGETFGFSEKKTKERFKRAKKYYLHHFIGPMPVEEFLDTFMNRQRVLKERDLDSMPPSGDAFASVPEQAKKESDIYKPLIDSLNPYVDPKTKSQRGSRCPGFLFVDTSDRSDKTQGSLGGVKPDVCCYAEPHVELVLAASTEETKSRNQGATVMGYAALFIEIKRHKSLDPFKDPPPGEDRAWWRFLLNLEGVGATKQEQVQECFGQNATYAAEILARQHRQFLYSISLCGSFARIIRWDRAGALCTNAFDIRESPGHLCEFFWCFAVASDMERGYDLNVEMAHPYEQLLFQSSIRQHLLSQAAVYPTALDGIGAIWDLMESIHFLEGHVTAIRIPLSNSGAVQRLLVSRPLVYPLAAFGSGTRTYWAVDVTAPHHIPPVVLLKDTWRENPPASNQTEREIVQRLTTLGVDNVPNVLSCEDVIQRDEIITRFPDNTFRVVIQDLDRYQSTRTQDFLNAPWVCGAHLTDHLVHVRIRKYTHHRLVLDTAGPTLAQFCGTHELLATTLDVLQTLNGASKEAGIVHRALSPRSIILYRQPTMARDSRRRGYLIDWDQAWNEGEDLSENNPFSPPWQFVCSALAAHIATVQRYTMEHDMEALFYVVLYLAILCLPATPDSQKAGAVAQAIKLFEGEHVDGGQPSSNAKHMNKTSRLYTQYLDWKNPQMKRWMDKMLAALKPLPDTTPESQWTYTDVKILWEKLLAGTKFEEDRMHSLAPLNGREANAPHALRPVPNCPTMFNPGSLGAKRDLSSLYGGADPVCSSFVKRVRTTLALETLGRSEGPLAGEPSTAVTRKLYTDTEPSLLAESGRRGVPETATNAEAGPSRLPGSHVDVASSAATSDPASTNPIDSHGAPEDPMVEASNIASRTGSGSKRRKARAPK